MVAAQRGCGGHVAALLDAGADVNVVAADGWTALLLAASESRWAVVATPLGAAADAAVAGGPTRSTALHWAAGENHAPTVRALAAALTAATAAHGGGSAAVAAPAPAAGVDARREDGSTPLMLAAHAGATAAIAALLNAGAVVDAPPRNDGNNALHLGILEQHEPVVHLLLARGASVEARTTAGYTPLHLATEQLSVPVVRALLLAGADVAAATPDGDTALHLAAYWGGDAVVVELLARGADPEVRNQKGSMPAGEATAGGHVALTRVLVVTAGGSPGTTAAAAAAAKVAAAAAAKAAAAAVRTRSHDGGPLVTRAGGGAGPPAVPATCRSFPGRDARGGLTTPAVGVRHKRQPRPPLWTRRRMATATSHSRRQGAWTPARRRRWSRRPRWACR